MSLAYTQIAPRTLYIHDHDNTEFLDESFALIQSGDVKLGMMLLGEGLYELYMSTGSGEWDKLVKEVLLQHPLRTYLMQDPLTARSFNRPRGYAGDAKLLDMVYFPESLGKARISKLGRQVFRYTSRTSLSHALIQRIKLIAAIIDENSNESGDLKILSVASGHCREAEFSNAIKTGSFNRFVAIDHDSRSLDLVNQHYSSINIETVCESVTSLIRDNAAFGKFDLIYSAGLYDYLSNRFAQKLTSNLFDMLSPGGKLVLMNIDTDYKEIGYMESFMNWSMIGRNALDLLELAGGLDTNEHADLKIREGEGTLSHFNVLEITKT